MNLLYSVSSSFLEKVVADDRKLAVKITIGSSTELTGTTIQDITLDEIVNSTDSLTLGCACSNKITINLINPPTDIDYNNLKFKAYVGIVIDDSLTYEWVPLGEFYVTEAETNNDFKSLKLTAYDGFCKMMGKYIPNISGLVMLQDVYVDLKNQLYAQCGITLKSLSMPDYEFELPLLDITFQQAIGFVAGCAGAFARFDRTGELEILKYDDISYTIERRLQYLNGFKRLTDKPLIITSISTGTQENPIVRGIGANGTNINFENPYMTDEMADDIYSDYNNLTYTPCQIKWRGNPAIQAGDKVKVVDKDNIPHTVLIMAQTIKIGSGCNTTINCYGTSTISSEFSSNYETVSKKIERVYTTLQQSILDATNSITGNSGGYVMMHDTNNDGKPDEILIMDIEDITLATRVWRWNKEGLGYSYNPAGNAYLGPYKTAITANGQIVADFITTGTLSAERIAVENFDATDPTRITDYIHFGNGTMTFGKGNSALTLKLENNQVAFYSGTTRIAYFSSNSFEIENLSEGKIRFQNFGFIPRASGNLTFTKLT